MLLDVEVKPNKKALQTLIDGIDNVCKKVVENETKKYHMNSFQTCIIGVNYGSFFYSTLSHIFKLEGNPFECNMDDINASDMVEEYKEVNKLFVSQNDMNDAITSDEWLLMAGKVRTYLEHKLENYVEVNENV